MEITETLTTTLCDLSIIIVNWNTKDLLLRCLQSVFSTANGLDYEVIVVDNASTDDSLAAVQEYYPRVKIIQNQENVGFAKANNQAINLARGRYYLLLNTDAFVHQGTLKTLINYMDAFPKIGAAGCRLYYEDGTLQRSANAFPTLFTELWQALWLDRLFPNNQTFGKYTMSYWGLDDFREVDWVMGACMILRREAIEQVGLLDERFFMYSEEADLCYRIKHGGWIVSYIPDASATHLWGGTSRKVPSETFLRLYRSRILFFRKHYGILTTWLYKLVLLMSSLVRITGGSLANLIKKSPDLKQRTRNYWTLLLSLLAF